MGVRTEEREEKNEEKEEVNRVERRERMGDEERVRSRVEGENGGRELWRETGILEGVWTGLRKGWR